MSHLKSDFAQLGIRHVLVVDDNPAHLAAARTAAQALRPAVTFEFHDKTTSAIAAIEAQPAAIDLVVTDFRMGGADNGVAVYEAAMGRGIPTLVTRSFNKGAPTRLQGPLTGPVNLAQDKASPEAWQNVFAQYAKHAGPEAPFAMRMMHHAVSATRKANVERNYEAAFARDMGKNLRKMAYQD